MSEKLDRAAETPYQKACKAACEWCAKGVIRIEFNRQWHSFGRIMQDFQRCTAPTPEAFMDAQAAEIERLNARVTQAEKQQDMLSGREFDAAMQIQTLREALRRAEMKLSAYVGVCKGDKELTGAVLPMVSAALAQVSASPKEGK